MDVKNISEILQGTILDVRWNDQFSTGHIPSAVNIPSNEIEYRLEEVRQLPRPIVVCCQSGFRSRLIARLLKYEGIDVEVGGDWRELARLLDSLKKEPPSALKKEVEG